MAKWNLLTLFLEETVSLRIKFIWTFEVVFVVQTWGNIKIQKILNAGRQINHSLKSNKESEMAVLWKFKWRKLTQYRSLFKINRFNFCSLSSEVDFFILVLLKNDCYFKKSLSQAY